MAELNEEEILAGCLRGDRYSQEILYRRHADKMFSVCLYYADDRDEACDFLQEGFITVFTKLEQYSGNGSLEGWIRRVIVNTAIGHLRKKKRLFESVDDLQLADEDVDYFNEEAQVPFKKVVELVNQLPEKASLVLKLFAIEGYSHQEIAEQLGITVGTSKSQLNRARFLLKEEFSKYSEA